MFTLLLLHLAFGKFSLHVRMMLLHNKCLTFYCFSFQELSKHVMGIDYIRVISNIHFVSLPLVHVQKLLPFPLPASCLRYSVDDTSVPTSLSCIIKVYQKVFVRALLTWVFCSSTILLSFNIVWKNINPFNQHFYILRLSDHIFFPIPSFPIVSSIYIGKIFAG